MKLKIFQIKETEEFFYHLKKEEGGKQSTFNRLVRSIPQKRHEKIIKESETYINRVYYNNYEQEK